MELTPELEAALLAWAEQYGEADEGWLRAKVEYTTLSDLDVDLVMAVRRQKRPKPDPPLSAPITKNEPLNLRRWDRREWSYSIEAAVGRSALDNLNGGRDGMLGRLVSELNASGALSDDAVLRILGDGFIKVSSSRKDGP